MEKLEDAPIYFYRKNEPFGFMSNFYPSPITIDGKHYSTVEHYFQSQKFVGSAHELEIIKAAKPVEAFRLGQSREFPIRKNWEEVKDEVMYRGLHAKYTQIEELKKLLLDTKDRRLVEHTTNDKYWADGGGNGKGKNRLGELLMRLRTELRKPLNS
jgi:ribA/ribD-fused uncharacterized protein